jgi:hypothetical protein
MDQTAATIATIAAGTEIDGTSGIKTEMTPTGAENDFDLMTPGSADWELLENLGRRISAHLERAARCDAKAADHRISAGRLLVKAEAWCKSSGLNFDAFHEKFCPHLGRTRTYELLQIASGKKTDEQIRASNAERNRNHRAEKKAAEVVRHVTDEPLPEQAQPVARPADDESPGADVTAQAVPRKKHADKRLERFHTAISVISEVVERTSNLPFPPNLTARWRPLLGMR